VSGAAGSPALGPWRVFRSEKEIPAELVERMVALVRQIAGPWPLIDHVQRHEARAIAALLPEPVDPDLIEAREIALKYGLPGIMHYRTTNQTRDGACDDMLAVQLVLEAIKRGRELAKRDPSHAA
jgi:hypothetical protein